MEPQGHVQDIGVTKGLVYSGGKRSLSQLPKYNNSKWNNCKSVWPIERKTFWQFDASTFWCNGPARATFIPFSRK